MRKILLAFLFAVLGASLIAALYRPRPLEQQLLRLQVQQSFPENADLLTEEPPEIQALLLTYMDDPVLSAKARVALIRYPQIARPLFLMYGDEPAFREVLRRYGEDALLPVQYFVQNDVFTLDLIHGLGETVRSATQALRELWGAPVYGGEYGGDDAVEGGASDAADASGGPSPAQGESDAGVPDVQPGVGTAPAPASAGERRKWLQALTPEERGRYAIYFVAEEGHDFLGQFVLAPDGTVQRVQTERILEGLNQFFAGGLKGLETKVRRDESIGAADVGNAALDVAVGVGAFKLLRLGRGTAGAAGSSLTLPERTAVIGAGLWRGTVVGARVARYGAPAVLLYMAVRHPSIINSVLGDVAGKFGLPVEVVQIAGWTLVLWPVLLILRLLLLPLAWVLASLARLLRYSVGRSVPRHGYGDSRRGLSA